VPKHLPTHLPGSGGATRRRGSVAQPKGAHMPTLAPPYQFIAIARTIARGFTEQAAGGGTSRAKR